VATRTGLSRSTINQRLDALLDTRLVVPSGAESTKGRPAEAFAFNRTGGYLLVADIGATGMRAGLCDLSGTILAEVELTVSVTEGPDIVLGLVGDEFAKLLAGAGALPDSVVGIGASVPGPVDTASGQVVHPPIMTGWDQYDIPGWFSRGYDCPVVVDKDANAMAFGEQQISHPDVRHLLMVKVGTGVGSGLISDGRLHRGADGAAGDIGHNYVPKPAYVQDEPECRCGNIGCLEAYAGGWAILRDLQSLGVEADSVDDAVRLLRSGNRDAVRLARNASQLLGEAIAVTVNLFNPQVVVIGGQLAAADDYLFAGIKSAVYRRSLPLATRRIQIVGATQGKQAGIIGLALLVAQSVFSDLPLPTLRSALPHQVAV
jgi:predicted NBD/HSP70 family sugar kinase